MTESLFWFSSFDIRHLSFAGTAIFAVSNRMTIGLNGESRTRSDATPGDKTAVRASRLIQSLPRYISA